MAFCLRETAADEPIDAAVMLCGELTSLFNEIAGKNFAALAGVTGGGGEVGTTSADSVVKLIGTDTAGASGSAASATAAIPVPPPTTVGNFEIGIPESLMVTLLDPRVLPIFDLMTPFAPDLERNLELAPAIAGSSDFSSACRPGFEEVESSSAPPPESEFVCEFVCELF